MIWPLDALHEAEMEPSIKDFHHPFKPYDIQSELMSVIYQCIAEGKIGILESPTGLLLRESFPTILIQFRNCTSNEHYYSHLRGIIAGKLFGRTLVS